MAPSFSRPTGSNGMETLVLQQRGPPPIPFTKEKSVSAPANSRDLFVSISLRTDPGKKDSGTFEQKVRTFSQGTAEEFIRWRMAFDEVVRAKPLTSGKSKVGMANVLLTGAAKDLFAHHLLSVNVAPPGAASDDEDEDDDAIFDATIAQLSKQYVPLDGLAKQKAYLRYHLRLGNIGVKPFVARLQELNNYLSYFPNGSRASKLPDDELIEIIDRAKPLEWHVAMLTANIDPSTMSLQEVTEYFERLELMEKLRKSAAKAATPSATTNPTGGKSTTTSTTNKKRSASGAMKTDEAKHCLLCNTTTHNTVDCFYLKKAQKMGGKKAAEPRPSYEKLREELNMLKKQASAKSTKKAHFAKRESDGSDSDESVFNMDTEEVSQTFPRANPPMQKRRKLTQHTTEIIAEITDKKGLRRVLRVLLDTGTSASIILAKFTKPSNTSSMTVRPTT
jgi:hypothetical protein